MYYFSSDTMCGRWSDKGTVAAVSYDNETADDLAEATEACAQLFQDMFGVRPDHGGKQDAMFDIVAIPDDCAELSGLGYEPRLGGSCASNFSRKSHYIASVEYEHGGPRPMMLTLDERKMREAKTARRK
jgi:hypothetical protein